MRRFWVPFALALAVTFTVSDSAEAKKDKKKKKGDEETTEQVETAEGETAEAEPTVLMVEMTGIADVDNVFGKAVAPLQTLQKAGESLDSLNKNLATALALPEGTPFADALSDLTSKAEGKINMAISEKGVPELSAGDAVPENVQNAINAVNDGMKNVMDSVESLTELPGQFKEIIAAAQSINPKSLISSGVKPMDAPKIMKTITGNIKTLTKAPEVLKEFTDSVMNTKNTLTGAFGGGGGE